MVQPPGEWKAAPNMHRAGKDLQRHPNDGRPEVFADYGPDALVDLRQRAKKDDQDRQCK